MWRMSRSFTLLALGLLSLSLAQGQEPPQVNPPEDVQFPDVEEMLRRLPPDQRERARQEFRRIQVVQRGSDPFSRGRDGWTTRLGVEVQMPPAALIEQLDLPKDQGLLLGEVSPESPAGKAGLRSYDILLEIDGKPVARDLDALMKKLAEFKEDARVSLVILRKGKNETIKELALTKAQERDPRDFRRGDPRLPDVVRPPDLVRPVDPMPLPVPGGRGVMTVVFRSGDRFTARHQEGSLIINLVGEGNKVRTITVQDGRENGHYEAVDKVPEAYRDRVKNLVEMLEKSSVKVEIKEK